AARLLVYVLLFSLLLSLFATGLQLVGEYDRRTTLLQQAQTRAAELISSTLSQEVWLMNYSETNNKLDDLLLIPTIQYVRLTTAGGERFTAGTQPSGRTITQQFPLSFNHSTHLPAQSVGTLTVST